MKQVRVDTVRAGMIVARNVYSNNGSLLMAQGTHIDSIAIAQLTRHGVQHLWVTESDEGSDHSEKDANAAQEVQALLDAQFEGVAHNPLMEALKRICSNYLLKKRGA